MDEEDSNYTFEVNAAIYGKRLTYAKFISL